MQREHVDAFLVVRYSIRRTVVETTNIDKSMLALRILLLNPAARYT